MAAYEELLVQHTQKVAMRHERLVAFAQDILPRLENDLWVNGKLDQGGHGELRMRERIELAPLNEIPDPTNPDEVGHFGRSFRIPEGDSIEKIQQLRIEGTTGKDLSRYSDHRSRPAFYRALTITPALMVNLVANISSYERPLGTFGPEIWLAYQVMSKLVDARDPGALKADGRPNRSYLFERHLSLIRADGPQKFAS